jgi:hypothetical protein
MLPVIESPEAYKQVHGQTSRFSPVIRAIAQRHHLPAEVPSVREGDYAGLARAMDPVPPRA